MALGTLKNLSRLAEVASVLVQNGFADLAERLDLPGSPKTGPHVQGEKLGRRYSVWARLRMVAEDLGPLLDDPAVITRMTSGDNPFGDGHAAERIVAILWERLSTGRQFATPEPRPPVPVPAPAP